MYAIIGVEAFGEMDPALFGDLSNSTFTLFQVISDACYHLSVPVTGYRYP
jgi:hypothetical protein